MKKSKAITNLLVAAIVANNTTGINALENQTEDIINNEEVIELKEVTTEGIVEEKEETEEKKEGGDVEGGSSNPTESNLPQSGEQSGNTGDTVQPETNRTPVVVNDFNTLKKEVTKPNNLIELQGNITVDSMLSGFANGVTVEGKNAKLIVSDTIDLKSNIIEVKDANKVEINNLTIENYINTAIACVRTTGTTLNNITLKGRGFISKDEQSRAGLDISDNSNVNIQSIKTYNNKQAGIRVKGSSTLNMLGGNTHINDTNQLVVVIGSDNKLNDQAEQYKEVGKDDKGNILYGKKVTDFATLQDAVTKKGNIIELENDIVVTSKLQIAEGVTIDGTKGKLIADDSLKDNTLIEIKKNNVTITNLTIENYLNTAIACYGTTKTTLNNITLKGRGNVDKDVQSKVGLEIAQNSNVNIQSINTSNNTQAGIRVKGSSTLTMLGGNTHVNDTNQLVVVDSTNTLNQQAEQQYSEVDKKNNNIIFALKDVINVTTEQELIDAVSITYSQINILNDITLTKELVINKSGVKINGGNNVIDCNKDFKIKVNSYAKNVEISNLKFENYLNQGLSLYNAIDTKLTNITLQGNEYILENEQRSKVGLDIYNSTVTINGIKSINHIYRGIQIRGGSKVTLMGSIEHFNDSLHIKVIDKDGAEQVELINADSYYKEKTTVENVIVQNGIQNETNYYTREVIQINTAEDFAKNVRNSGTILSLNNDITFNESMIDELDKYNPQMLPDSVLQYLPQFKSELECNVQANIKIEGNGNTIDLNNICGLVAKGDNIEIKDVTITNSLTNGVAVFNSNNATLNKVTVKEAKKSGIVANGSNVNIVNCKTINNGECGIMATRSRTLDNPDNPTAYRDSKVIIKGELYQEESNRCMMIRNVEMVKTSDHKQNNQIIIEDELVAKRYNKIVNDEVKSTLSDLYKLVFKDWFEANNIPFNKEFGIQETDFMKVLDRIDVTKQREYLENGVAVVMKNDGSKDETENFKKLLRYATLHGKELYFPAGTYKISSDIDLNQLNTPAFSNVKITGDSNGLSIIDGSLSQKMIKIINSNYHSYMDQVNINNLVFKNIGLELNGVYKKNISINNNVFVDGKYTTENNKITMVPYITANNGTYEIEKNIFLRGQEYAGRGISTYATKNTVIKDNFFGNLEGKDDALTMIPSLANKLNLLTIGRTVTGRQGNFFTCINNERRDTNVTIQNNYFDMNESRNIEGVPSDALISGIDVSKEGQRKDHIIYSKGYNGLNIVGNYFKGMENGAAGGVKIRNGNGAYIGSNHFKDVPLLTYIYGDLTPQECELINTTIYNNLFHETKNIGGQGTNILYYQSFRNGDDVKFPSGETVNGLQANVKNFVVYKNKFLSGDKSVVTISNRAEQIKDQFLFLDNKYEDKNELVNFNKGNLTIADTTVDVIEKALNGGYTTHNKVEIPLYPTKADKTQLPMEMDKANKFIESIKENVGDKEGQYSPVLVKQLKEAIKKAEEINNNANTTQLEINNAISEIHRLIDKINRDLNPDGSMDSGTTPNLPDDDLDGVIPETKPEIPDSDVVVSPEEDEEQPSIEDVVNEGGVGSAYEPVNLIVNTLKGLEQILSSIVNSGSHISLFRLEDPTVDENKVVYKLHVIDGDSSYYIDIKVDSNADELTNLLNKIPNINDEENKPPVDGETKPETPVPPVDEDVKLPIDDENKENNNGNSSTINPGNGNSSNESTSNSGSNNNPQTGDIGVLGSIGLGLTSILGIFINNRKKKK